jgi:hypothetical protein
MFRTPIEELRGERATKSLPDSNHVVVDLLQLCFCGVESVWRRIELVGLKGFVRQANFERLVIFLRYAISVGMGRGGICCDGSPGDNGRGYEEIPPERSR